MATANVATAKVAHGHRAMGRRAGDHIRSGNRTMIDLLLGHRRAILPIGSRPRQPWTSGLSQWVAQGRRKPFPVTPKTGLSLPVAASTGG